MTGWDIIGDIHGYLDPLKRMLDALGYIDAGQGLHHPAGRRILFLGDLIDRGPDMLGVIHLVRDLVDRGQARVVMGNHELNLLAMRTVRADGTPARAHEGKGRMRDYERTVKALGSAIDACCDWFRTLPMWCEVDGFRAVHAAWHHEHMKVITKARGGLEAPLTDEFIIKAYDKNSDLYHACETVLKGCEVGLPDGVTFTDQGETVRDHARVQWFHRPIGDETIADWAMPPGSIQCAVPAAPLAHFVPGYSKNAPPCFVGHYWLHGDPDILADNVVCCDYGVARGPEKGGQHPAVLAAYRFDGQFPLSSENFLTVPAIITEKALSQ